MFISVFFFLWEKLGEFYPFKPKVAKVLFLGQDMVYKKSVILKLFDEVTLLKYFPIKFFFFFFFGFFTENEIVVL